MKKLCIILILFLSIQAVYAQESNIAKIDMPAIGPDGKGMLTELEVEIIPGKGRTLLNSAPLTGIQTQYSERTAVDIAEKYTGTNFSQYDVIFTINAEARVVDGPSAGAGMAVAVIAAAENKTVRDDVSITGTIQADGRIGAVGGIVEKAKAAAEGGDQIFLIPAGQIMQATLVEKVETPAPGWTIKRVTTEYINVSQYAEENLNITILEVTTIDDAISIFLDGENVTSTKAIEVEEKKPEGPKVQSTELLDIIAPMKALSEQGIDEAEKLVADARAELDKQEVETARKYALVQLLDSSDELLAKAKTGHANNYFYSSANNAFRAKLNAKYVRDLAKYYPMDEKEKIDFTADRIEETYLVLSKAQELNDGINALAQDRGVWEWAVAAQQRLAQAEKEYSQKSEDMEETFLKLALIEEWSQIAEHFYNIANEHASGELIDLSDYNNKSIESIARAEALASQFQVAEKYGAQWWLDVSKHHFEKNEYLAACLSAKLSSLRSETSAEMSIISWDNFVQYVEDEIDNVTTGDSVWGTLYRDYAIFTLQFAKNEKNMDLLKDALIYARQAEAFSMVSEEMQNLPTARKPIMRIRGKQGIVIGLSFFLASLLILMAILSKTKFKKEDVEEFVVIKEKPKKRAVKRKPRKRKRKT